MVIAAACRRALAGGQSAEVVAELASMLSAPSTAGAGLDEIAGRLETSREHVASEHDNAVAAVHAALLAAAG